MRDRYASLREGLVGAWIPSVSGSGLLLPDLSGRGNNGTLTNMGPEDWVSSQYGRALDFDGVNDYVDTGIDASKLFVLNIPWSLTFWLNLQPGSLSNTRVLGASLANRFYISYTSGRDLFWGWGNQFNQPSSYILIDEGYYNSIAYTYDGGTIRAYKDGRLQGSTLYTGNGNVDPNNLTLGDIPSGSLPMAGQLDDVRIYNRALSESEIKLLASRPGIGLRPQRRTMYYAPPTGARRRRILTSMP